MAKFHVNPITGQVSACRASKVACPFGEENHADTAPAASMIYEKSIAKEDIKTITKRCPVVSLESIGDLPKELPAGFRLTEISGMGLHEVLGCNLGIGVEYLFGDGYKLTQSPRPVMVDDERYWSAIVEKNNNIYRLMLPAKQIFTAAIKPNSILNPSPTNSPPEDKWEPNPMQVKFGLSHIEGSKMKGSPIQKLTGPQYVTSELYNSKVDEIINAPSTLEEKEKQIKEQRVSFVEMLNDHIDYEESKIKTYRCARGDVLQDIAATFKKPNKDDIAMQAGMSDTLFFEREKLLKMSKRLFEAPLRAKLR